MISKISDINLLIDGVIFQKQEGKPLGISNVWRNLIDLISNDNRFKQITILDRGFVPRMDGIEYVPFETYNEKNHKEDALAIENICIQKNIHLFITTYFTTARDTYSICVLHDFIPEKLGMNLNSESWISKIHCIQKTNAYIAVSKTTLQDFKELYPKYTHRNQSIVYNCISQDFSECSHAEKTMIRKKYNLNKGFFLIVGQRMSYKNAVLFFKAFSMLENKNDYQIVCVGGFEKLEYILRFFLDGFEDFLIIQPTNRELSILLSEAEALVYPSLYEGFGMPILEAMASSCPVIISEQSKACIEVAQDAAIVIDGFNVNEMKKALEALKDEKVRHDLINKGRIRARDFSQNTSLNLFYDSINLNLEKINNHIRKKNVSLG